MSSSFLSYIFMFRRGGPWNCICYQIIYKPLWKLAKEIAILISMKWSEKDPFGSMFLESIKNQVSWRQHSLLQEEVFTKILIVGSFGGSIAHGLPPLDPFVKIFLLSVNLFSDQSSTILHFLFGTIDNSLHLLLGAVAGMLHFPLDHFPLGNEIAFLPLEQRLDGMFAQKQMHTFLVDCAFLVILAFVEVEGLLNSTINTA